MSRDNLQNSPLSKRELLMSTTHEKLVDILISLYDNNYNLQTQLDIIFAGLDDNPKKIVILIKKEITYLKKSSRFVEYYQSDSLANDLNDLRLRIINDLQAKSPKIAFEMMLIFLDLYNNTLERVDDSNGSVSEVFVTAAEDLASLAKNSNHLKNDELVELIFTLFMNDNYGSYSNIISNFKGILKDQDLDLLKRKIQHVANDTNSLTINNALKSIADCKDNVEEYIDACSSEDGINARNHIEIAKRFIKAERPKEALDWLDKMKTSVNHQTWQSDEKALKIQALELDGNYEHAQKERISWFAKNFDPDLYEEILKAAKPDFKESFKAATIKKAFKFSTPYEALRFLVHVSEFEEVAKFVRARFNELSGRQYSTFRSTADLLQNTDPVAATLLYRKMLEAVCDKAKSKYYNDAAKDLVTCDVLNSKISNWGTIQNHEEYLIALKRKHKYKISFWSEYQSALQKKAVKEAKMASREVVR